jgi:hypothetical protein
MALEVLKFDERLLEFAREIDGFRSWPLGVSA